MAEEIIENLGPIVLDRDGLKNPDRLLEEAGMVTTCWKCGRYMISVEKIQAQLENLGQVYRTWECSVRGPCISEDCGCEGEHVWCGEPAIWGCRPCGQGRCKGHLHAEE